MIEHNIYWNAPLVTRKNREERYGHKGCVIWFTGLSGSGKSTIANVLDHKLYTLDINTALLDGDNIRHKLNAPSDILRNTHSDEFANRFGLGFSAIDREENIRRIGAVAGLFAEAGVITMTAFISPYRIDRDRVRQSLESGDFIEVFVDTPIEICEKRDPKGLYKKARAGEIKGFTGVDDPYEPPLSPEIIIKGCGEHPNDLANQVIKYLFQTRKICI